MTMTMTKDDEKGEGPTIATKATAFPANTIAVMVHKHFAERVQEYLLTPLQQQVPWKTLVHRAGSDSPTDTATSNADPIVEETTKDASVPPSSSTATSSKMSLLDTTETSGVSHARRGYLVALVEDTVRQIHLISPMARQNIGWAMKLTHQLYLESNYLLKDANSNINMDKLAKQITETLPIDAVPLLYNAKQDILRVDCYPKTYTDAMCLGLQRAIHAKTMTTRQDDNEPTSPPEVPYEGPIAMTKSASKCSHRLSITITATTTMHSDEHADNDNNDASSNSRSGLRVCWGWAGRTVPADRDMMELRLNEFGAQEICNVSPDHTTGKEIGGKIVPIETPLSRAFYKLDQVFQEILEPHEANTLDTIQKLQASVADLGSAPVSIALSLHKAGCRRQVCYALSFILRLVLLGTVLYCTHASSRALLH